MNVPAPYDPATIERRLRDESVGMRALALGLLGNAPDADDCVQETWLRALQRPPVVNPRAWLYTVVRRLAFRRGRDAARRRRRELNASRNESVPSTAQIAEGLETRRRLLGAVVALDEPYRSAVVMRYLEDRSPTEIAALTGTPVKTIKTRLHRGLALLRESLDESHGGRRDAWTALLLPITAPRSSLATSGTSAFVAAAGGLLVMKKLAVAVVLLACLGAALVLSRHPAPEDSIPVADTGRAAVATTSSTLAAAPQRPTPPAEALGPASVLHAGDSVPDATFAGRVVDVGGQGVAGATVRLFWNGADRKRGEPDNGWHLILRRERERQEGPTATTDGAGYFRLDRPYGSSSFLRADAPGFAPAIAGRRESGSFVVMTLGKKRATRVRVLTEAGAAVVGAEVRLVTSSASGHASTREVLDVQNTDSTGSALFPVLESGALMLEAVPREPDLGMVEQAARAGDTSVEMRVSAAEVVERRVIDADTGLAIVGAWVDLLREFKYASPENELARRRFYADRDGVVRFPSQAGFNSAYASAPGYEVGHAYESPIELKRSMTVEGTIVDPDGRPVSGAALLVALPSGSTVFDAMYVGLTAVAAWSDERGRFTFEVKLGRPIHGEPPPDRGTRSIVALHSEYAAAIQEGVLVESGRRAQLSLRFPRPASLAITIVDASGAPMSNQWFQILRAIPAPTGWPAIRSPSGVDTIGLLRVEKNVTDERGRALIDRLPPGRHFVSSGTLTLEVDLRAGGRTELRMVKGAGARITGRLIDSHGSSVASRLVSLMGPDANGRQTDADGRFQFDDLRQGDYQLGVRWVGEQPFTVSAKPGDDVTIRLPTGPARLRVIVDGPSVGQWEYSLATESGGYSPERTGFASGDVAPLDTPGFTPGPGLLVVRAKGFGWTAVRFDSSESSTTEVRVQLAPSGTVTGKLGDTGPGKTGLVRLARVDGFPWSVTGTSSRLRYAVNRSKGDGDEHARVESDAEFRLEDVSAGAYDLSYGRYEEHKWISHGSVRVDVPSAGTVRADLTR